VRLMKTISFTAVFFYLSQVTFLSFVVAQSKEVPSTKRLKLLNADYVLLNGDSVKILDLDTESRSQIKQKIKVTCERNMKISQQAMGNTPKKAYYFAKSSLQLDSTFLPAHAMIIHLFLQRKDTASAYQNAQIAYRQTGSEKLLPILSVLEEGLANSKKQSLSEENSAITGDQNPRLNYLLGLGSYKDGNLSKAIQYFELAKDDHYADFAKATTKLMQNKDEKSIKAVHVFLEDSLLNFYAAHNLAVYYFKENQLDDALLWSNKALSINDTLLNMYYLRGYINYMLGQKEAALSNFKNCFSNDYKNAEALINAAICQYNLKLYKEALESANTAIEINDKVAENFLLRGNAYEMLHQFTQACEDWHRAVALGRSDILPLITEFCKPNNPD